MATPAEMQGFQPGAHVRDPSGGEAEIIALDRSGSEPVALLRLANGTRIALPTSLLREQEGKLHFGAGFDALQGGDSGATVIPVIEERIEIGKRQVDTGRGVRLKKTVHENTETVDPPLMQDELVIEHIPCDRLLPEGADVRNRQEGETLIMPVVEEILVVQKRLRIKEEVRITRRRTQAHRPQQVLLRKEELQVQRFDEPPATPAK